MPCRGGVEAQGCQVAAQVWATLGVITASRSDVCLAGCRRSRATLDCAGLSDEGGNCVRVHV
eukprot:737487-Alexandrium_andersonii.AAC.1